MNREEILAKSKQENRGQDIVGLAAARDSMQLGWVVMICLLAAVTVVDAIVFERMNNEVFFVVVEHSDAVCYAYVFEAPFIECEVSVPPWYFDHFDGTFRRVKYALAGQINAVVCR